MNTLRESPDYELVVLEQKQPGIIQKVAQEQIEAMAAEAALLAEEAERLKLEIDELVSGGSSIA